MKKNRFLRTVKMTLWAAAALLAAQTAAAGRFDPPDLAEVPFKALSVDQYRDAGDARAAKGRYEAKKARVERKLKKLTETAERLAVNKKSLMADVLKRAALLQQK